MSCDAKPCYESSSTGFSLSDLRTPCGPAHGGDGWERSGGSRRLLCAAQRFSGSARGERSGGLAFLIFGSGWDPNGCGFGAAVGVEGGLHPRRRGERALRARIWPDPGAFRASPSGKDRTFQPKQLSSHGSAPTESRDLASAPGKRHRLSGETAGYFGQDRGTGGNGRHGRGIPWVRSRTFAGHLLGMGFRKMTAV